MDLVRDIQRDAQKKGKVTLGRILNKELFVYILDLEIKRARRYQNFLCLLDIELKKCNDSYDDYGGDLKILYQTICNLLIGETRESDILGSLEENQLMILLPYADLSAGDRTKSRLESIFKIYDFKSKGYEIMINQISFPANGADTIDLIKNAFGINL
jgi:PleD family two-component response regulator